MAIVAGVDFGTLSVRVSIVDSERGPARRPASAEYPLHAASDDPDHATQTPRRPHGRARAGATRAGARRRRACAGARRRGHRARHHRVERDPGRRRPRSRSTTTTSGATTAPGGRRREITATAHASGARGDRLVRRRLLLRVGLLEAAALAAAQPGQARPVRHRARALRHGGGRRCAASPIRDQVPRSVCAMGHKWMWNPALGGLPPEEFLRHGRSAAGRRARASSAAGTRPRTRSPGTWRRSGPSGSGLRAGHPDSGRRLRRALGRDRRGRAAGRRGQRGRHLDLHHGHQRHGRPASRASAAWCRVGPSRATPGIEAGLSATGDIFDAIARRAGTTVAALSDGLGRLPRRADRAAAPDLGQRRPHGAGESRTGRRHARLEPHAHGAGRAVRRHRGHRASTRASSWSGWRSMACRSAASSTAAASRRRTDAQPGVRQRAEQADPGAGRGGRRAWARRSSRSWRPARSRRSRTAQDALCPAYDVVEPDPAQRGGLRASSSRCTASLYFALGRRTPAPAAIGARAADAARDRRAREERS